MDAAALRRGTLPSYDIVVLIDLDNKGLLTLILNAF